MDFNYMRQRSLFDPYDPTQATSNFNFQSTPPRLDFSTPDDQEDEYSKLFKNIQSGPAQQRYRDFLDTEPQRENYQPGKVRKIAALLAGTGSALQGEPVSRAVNTTRDILDEPYNEAYDTFKNKAARMKLGADIEEKDISNRIKQYRDILEDQAKQRNEARQNRLADSTIAYNQARTKNAGAVRNIRINPLTGHKEGTTYNADGSFSTVDMGIGDLTPQEKTAQRVKQAVDIYHGQVPDREAVARSAINARTAAQTELQNNKFKNIKDLIAWKNDNMPPKYNKVEVRDGNVVFVNSKDPNDVIDTGYASGRLTDKEKIDLGLKAKEELKQTPGAGSTTTSTTVKKGDTSTTTRTVTPQGGGKEDLSKKPPPAGAKPGGKWITPTIYQEP